MYSASLPYMSKKAVQEFHKQLESLSPISPPKVNKTALVDKEKQRAKRLKEKGLLCG